MIYSTCDICSKDFFVETVKVFIGSEMVDSLGYCEFCGFNKSKEYIFLDRYFKNTWYETIENINSIDIICTFIEKFNGFFSNYKEEKDKEEQFSKLKHDIYSKKTNLTNVLIRYLENRLSKLDKEINRIDLFISNNLCDIVEEYNDIMYYIEVYFKIFNEDILKSNDLNSLFKDSKKQIEEIINRMSIFIKERLEKAKEVESYINNFYREENSYYYDLLNNELNSSIICGDIWDNLDGEYSKWGIIHKIEDITILREYFVQKISRGIEEVSVVLIECEIVTAQYCGDGDFSSNLERIYVEIEITSIEDLEPKIKVTYIKFAKQY